VHFADWEGIEPFDDSGDTLALIHATGRGIDFPHIPMPGGVIGVSVHARADRAEIGGNAEEYYLATLKKYPRVWSRFGRAKMVTPVRGVKKIANRYHQAGGPGWVLVGDALHHKDPVDGQGIYDALVEGKVLAEALLSVREGRRTEGEALAFYEERVREETHGMFLATMDRLKRELYDEPPEMVIKTLLRWLITDPEYQRRFVLFLYRAIPPEGWLPPSLMRDAAVRGALRDLRDRVLGGAGDGAKPRLGGAAG
jgi:flavin-dependent dehydrogenase